MESYYIKERNMSMTYIELRFLMEVECSLKAKKITDILVFLNSHGFINCLTMFYTADISAENIIEQDDVMSLTIDMRDDKLRFKFWNGTSVMWLFHTEDLFNALSTGREKFSNLYDKYEPLTEVLLNFKSCWNTAIDNVSYKYYPDSDIEVVYDFLLTDDTSYTRKVLKKLDNVVNNLDFTDDLKFSITHSFKPKGCIPCQQAKKERDNDGRK